jgi:hypothetical protein
MFVYFDSADRAEAIELGRPDNDEDVVFFRDVFGAVADELLRSLKDSDVVEVAEQGCAVTLPDLLVALWRPVVPEDPPDEVGRYFESRSRRQVRVPQLSQRACPARLHISMRTIRPRWSTARGVADLQKNSGPGTNPAPGV